MTGVSACQLRVAVGRVVENRVHGAIEQAAGAGAEPIVLPELVPNGYVFKDAPEAHALTETPDGPAVREWRDLSRRLGVVFVGWFCQRGPAERPFNSAVLIDHGV